MQSAAPLHTQLVHLRIAMNPFRLLATCSARETNLNLRPGMQVVSLAGEIIPTTTTNWLGSSSVCVPLERLCICSRFNCYWRCWQFCLDFKKQQDVITNRATRRRAVQGAVPCESVSLSPSLSYSHCLTHTHTHTHTERARARARTHIHTHIQAHAHTHTHIYQTDCQNEHAWRCL